MTATQAEQPAVKTFSCQTCSRTYKKREHLQRHERSHTKEQPFRCPICSRQFGRQDSLLRHRKLIHAQAGGSSDAPRPSRRSSAGASASGSPDDPASTPAAGPIALPETQASNVQNTDMSTHPEDMDAADVVVSLSRQASASPAAVSETNPFAWGTPFFDVNMDQYTAFSPTSPRPLPVNGNEQGQSAINEAEPSILAGSSAMAEFGVGQTLIDDSNNTWPFDLDFLQAYCATNWLNGSANAGGSSLNGETFNAYNDFSLLSGIPDFSTAPAATIDQRRDDLPQPAANLPEPARLAQANTPSTPTSIHESRVSDNEKSEAFRQARILISDVGAAFAGQDNLVTGAFFNTCLTFFWERFNAYFPILHRPTFDTKLAIAPLLLNLVAIGSLFYGTKAARARGQVLWSLAHKGVASAWEKLIRHKGEYDHTEGVQLVLTALMGQTYANLSGDSDLRATSRIWHPLGFRWAEESLMRTRFKPSDLTPSGGEVAIDTAWREWAAGENQRRATLGHYIIDGLICITNNQAPSVRHTMNGLPWDANDKMYTAQDAESWYKAYQEENNLPLPTFRSYRGLFVDLFGASSPQQLPNLSFMALGTVLEGLQALITETKHAQSGPVLGMPSSSDIDRALRILFARLLQLREVAIPATAPASLIIRCHAAFIDLLCGPPSHEDFKRHSNNAQHQTASVGMQRKYNYCDQCTDRRGLLHAMSLLDEVDARPSGHPPAIHLTSSLFAASRIFLAYNTWSAVLGNRSLAAIDLPLHGSWNAYVDVSADFTSQENQDPFMAFLSKGGLLYRNGKLYDSSIAYISAVNHIRDIGKFYGVAEEVWNAIEDSVAELELGFA